jgi:hypothetical protein
MSYRITLNRPPVVECDTPEEVIALSEIAMQRVTSVEFTEPEPERIELPATTIQPKITAAAVGGTKPATPKGTAKSIAAYLQRKGKAARVSELCRELSLDEGRVRATLAGDEFLELGKGFFRLADGEPAADRQPSQPKRRGRPPKVKPEAEPESEADAADEWEEPTRPVRKPAPVKAAAPATPNLAERIRAVLKTYGALGTATIALHVDQPGNLVKEVLRSRPDWFRADGSGWELV